MFERIPGYDSPLFSEFRRLEQELDEAFGGGSTLTGTRNIRSLPPGTFPAVNVGTTGEQVAVYLFAPGLKTKSLDISIQQNLLSIAGEREIPLEKEAAYYRRERFTGAFRRVISLPEDVDPERVEAKYVDGIVKVTVGRRAAARPRQIEIH
jgi:HSP20 family protein